MLAEAEGGGSEAPQAQLRSREIPWPSGPPGMPRCIDPSGRPAVVRAQLRRAPRREAAKVKDMAQQPAPLMSEVSAAGASGR